MLATPRRYALRPNPAGSPSPRLLRWQTEVNSRHAELPAEPTLSRGERVARVATPAVRVVTRCRSRPLARPQRRITPTTAREIPQSDADDAWMSATTRNMVKAETPPSPHGRGSAP